MENMSNTGLTAGDILALTKDGDGFLGGGVGFIILLFIFIWAVFGGNGFGNRENGVTQSQFQNGLFNQTTDRNLSDIRDGIALTNQNVSTTGCGISKEILQNRYDNALLNANSNSLLQNCCCENRLAIANQTSELTRQMTQNTQAILDKLCSQEIQNLRDEVAGYRETLSNANQTQNILGQLGRFYINNPIGYYGTYPYYNGTTIV